jgi:hypothetical protein
METKELKKEIKQPVVWYVCEKCGEWTTPEMYKKSKTCQECKEGKLVKRCGYCGKKFPECECEWLKADLSIKDQ